MTDERIEADLAAYVDGDLSPSASGEIEQMIARSPRYRQMVAEMRQAKRWMTSLPPVAPPPGSLEQADPTMMRLERESLLGEPVSTGFSRFLTPNILGIAASLVVLLTLGISVVYLLPGDDGRQAVEDMPAIMAGAQATELSDPAFDPYQVRPQPAVEGDEAPEPPVADDNLVQPEPTVTQDPAAMSLSEAPDATLPDTPVEPSLPYVDGDSTLVAMSAREPAAAAGRIAAELATSGITFATRNTTLRDVADQLDPNFIDRLPKVGLAILEDRDIPVTVFVVPDPLDRIAITDVVGAATRSDSRAVANWTREAPDRAGPASIRIQRPGAVAPEQAEDDTLDEDAPRRLFPNDRIVISLRRLEPNKKLSPDLPESLAKELSDDRPQVEVPVDADGFADLKILGLGRIDVLGRTTGDVAKEVELDLAREYLVAVSSTLFTSRKADVPGGRTLDVVELLRVDRDPFQIGDAVRVEFESGERLEAVVAEDGIAKLGRVGEFKTIGRTAGSVQRELVARMADVLGSDAPPAVMNVSNRREAKLSKEDEETSPLVVIVLEEPAPATRPATQPTTAPSTRPRSW
jgi:protein involved in polysaccharide export with SLBB domain